MNSLHLFFALSASSFLSLNAATVARYGLNNDFLDSSGNGLHGTGTGGLSFTTDNAPFTSTGSHALNARVDSDFVSVPHDAAFELNTFTLEAIVRVPVNYTNAPPTIGTTSQYVAHKQRSTSSGNNLSSYGISVNQTTGVVNSTIVLNTGATPLTGSTQINDNEWHHLALVFDGSTLTLFVDGVLDNQATGLSGTILQGNAPFLIGAGNFATINGTGTFRRNFQGDIDELRLSDTALDTSEFLATPEPSSSILILLASVMLQRRRRSSKE